MNTIFKLDYTLNTPEERNELVKKILEENPNPPEKYLEILADYLVFCMEKQEKKEKNILNENHYVTIDKREISFEGLATQFENGEDGIYNLITEDKRVIFQPKKKITQHDLDTIPMLNQLYQTIQMWEKRLKQVSGKDAYVIKQAIKEMRQDQYVIKNAYQVPIKFMRLTRSETTFDLTDETWTLDDNDYPIVEGFSLMDPKVCSAILCNYSRLKQDSWDRLTSDTWCLMLDFENTCDRALEPYPIYQQIVESKIDGLQNKDIQDLLQSKFGVRHTVEYISSLWRNKIPKLIAAQAEAEYLDWYYLNVEKGKYKRCSKCGQIKLAHNKYFSKNNSSKDNFYSICKNCRSKKVKNCNFCGQNLQIE